MASLIGPLSAVEVSKRYEISAASASDQVRSRYSSQRRDGTAQTIGVTQMNTTKTSRCDQILALIDACLADVEGSLTPTAHPVASTTTSRPGPSLRR
jgi:hypothetical protein